MSITYALTSDTIILRSDGACIPPDPQNNDYIAYLAWVAAGNTPTPYIPPPAPPLSCDLWQIRAAMNRTPAIGAGATGTLRAQVEAIVSASTNQDIKDAWQCQQIYLETDAMLLGVAQLIGATTTDVHNLFLLAVTLSP